MQNKWLYMMGDSTQRQIWATFVSPFQSKFMLTVFNVSILTFVNYTKDNDFERNAKEWTRENVTI